MPPKDRSDWSREVAPRPEEPLLIDLEGKLRERSASRPEDDLCAIEHIEARLMARAQQLVGSGLVEANWAARVGAHLREGNEAIGRPVSRPGREGEEPRIHAYKHGLAALRVREALGEDRDEAVQWDRFR